MSPYFPSITKFLSRLGLGLIAQPSLLTLTFEDKI
ncbi:hypothetical protein Vi05172_g13709 [Venturia inaequalis]|nr:hypothetical protein Vi05172_g13709 [Venturia inaequalis]